MSTSRTDRLTIASRYAQAIFALSLAAKKEEEVVGAIIVLVQALGTHSETRSLLANPLLSRALKSGILVELLAKADTIAADSVRVIAEQGRAELLPEIAELLAKKLTDHKGELDAHVTSARALSSIEQKEVAAALTKAMGKKVNLTLTEEASVIGGLKVHVGSYLLDATVETALKRMRQQLLAA